MIIAGLTLTGCERAVSAPANRGVCWRQVDGLNGKPDFRVVAPNVETLEDCASRLEALRMAHGRPVTGAFQGRFIYVTDQEITAAAGPKAQRYRVFTPDQRVKIQDGVRTLMAREKGAAG
ncbi:MULTISPECIES: DDRGK domain-containing protein [Phenylobacterium]|uniref:Lipoprotein n=1 Tax=Phenylobacterium koreense TaxID=266125 RepID=A0ABV2EJS4_9CAUL